MDLLQTRNFARGRLAHRIRHIRAWRRLSRPHSHQLSFCIRIESERGESTLVALDGRAKVEPVNHYCILCSTKSTYISKKLVSLPNNASRAYIEVLLKYASSAKTSHLTSCLWNADIPGYMDDTLDVKSKYNSRDAHNTFKEIAL